MTAQYALGTKECFKINKRNPLVIVANGKWMSMSEIEVGVEIDKGGEMQSPHSMQALRRKRGKYK